MAVNHTFSTLHKVARIMNRISYVILYICLIGMTILVVVDTVLRSLFNFSIGGIPEATTYLLVIIGFLGLAITQSEKRHIEVTFISDRFPTTMKYFVKQIIHIISILFCILFIYAGTLKAVSAFATNESDWFGMHIFPIWFFRFVVPVGFGLLFFHLLIGILQTQKDLKNQREKTENETI